MAWLFGTRYLAQGMKRLKLLWQALTLDRRGLGEALEMLADIREFYLARDNYNPEPIQPHKEISIRFEEKQP
jgi:hypothetical protein